MLKQTMSALALSTAMLAQTNSGQPAQTAPQPLSPPVTQSAASPDNELTQMRDDLNRLESLNLNMSSEIEFLRDQNLQILLRTNSQMWTVIIRDLRRQIDREEQKRAAPQAPPR